MSLLVPRPARSPPDRTPSPGSRSSPGRRARRAAPGRDHHPRAHRPRPAHDPRRPRHLDGEQADCAAELLSCWSAARGRNAPSTTAMTRPPPTTTHSRPTDQPAGHDTTSPARSAITALAPAVRSGPCRNGRFVGPARCGDTEVVSRMGGESRSMGLADPSAGREGRTLATSFPGLRRPRPRRDPDPARHLLEVQAYQAVRLQPDRSANPHQPRRTACPFPCVSGSKTTSRT
jgi:hypothetical protein